MTTASSPGGGEALTLRAVRRLLDGGLPPTICSVSAEGMPHLNIISHVEYVDDGHVALTFQFFNRSRDNILSTRRVGLLVEDPISGGAVAMRLEYRRTETAGPIFERLRAKLAGIAVSTGMQDVFRLRGADLYAVREVRGDSPGIGLATLPARCDLAAGARRVAEALADCDDLDALCRTLMAGLRDALRIDHAILWLLDGSGTRLLTVASLGYPESGIGAELPLADAGLSAVALAQGVPLRIGHMARMYRYGQTLRDAARADADGSGGAEAIGPEIALPGLATPCSQLALPLRARGRAVGVLLLESGQEQFFAYDDEDALTPVCAQMAQAVLALGRQDMGAGQAVEPTRSTPSPVTRACPAPIRVCHHARTDTVFLDDHYLIKGVAGAIFWKLVNTLGDGGEVVFTTRALRLAGDELRLPELQDNLAVRLLMLQRRLAEWAGPLRIERVGRGRYRFVAGCPVELAPG